jgi:cephalosporin hydroxylase
VLTLTRDVLQSMQKGTFRYHWRGVPMVKSPFELALYPLVLWHRRPRTIFEMGSHAGGSALWLSDLAKMYKLDVHIHSFDLRAPRPSTSNIAFHECDVRVLNPSPFLATCPRPWLVIDDADHQRDSTLALLETWHKHLVKHDTYIVEDGIITALGLEEEFGGGPLAAVNEFLARHPDEYLVDRSLCDFWGPNFTWNPNGYLKRVA